MLKIKPWFDSLNVRVNKDIKTTILANKTYLSYKRNWLDSLLAVCNRTPSKGVLLAIVFSFLVSTLMTYFQGSLESLFGLEVNNIQSVINLLNIIASVQSAILGLLFPLVISFIGFLLKDRS